jgi:hypothetical protein
MIILHCVTAVLLLFSTHICAAESAIKNLSVIQDTSASLKQGERIYREGILPDGVPLRGYIKGDVAIDSTMFSCINCHARSGLGSVEGQIASPPVNGSSLFNPRYLFKDQVKNNISKSKGVVRQSQALRPAYTDETLATALRGGVDPLGRMLAPVMPRYALNDHDMTILVDYLKNLSAHYSPGVTETSLSFATIVTEDVSPTDRQAMQASLETLVTINQQTKTQKKLPQFSKMFRMLDTAFFREISIKTWELKGNPSTWNTQLTDYYRKEPVFAILGGISNQSWQPIHDFCETNKLPCLFPITDLPVVSDSDWYTMYASKGYFQEGETAARFLTNSTASGTATKVLQIVRTTPEGNSLASGFTATWNKGKEIGQLQTVELSANQTLDTITLQKLLVQYAPDSVIIWSGSDIITTLTDLTTDGKLPQIIVSARYLGKALTNIPPVIRNKVFITYPYRLPQDEKAFIGYGEILSLGKLKQADEKRIASRTFSMVHMFLQGLKEMKLDFYRDTLLDVLSMRPDQYLPDFERYSFGPGQRYASKGCYIVQLDQGTSPKLLKKSDWVVF